MRRLLLASSAVLALSATPALAWEDTGHRIIATVAAEALPPELPAFLKTPESVWRLGELSREPDRSRGAGHPHDDDLDPGHFLDLSDDGTILGGPPLAALPADRKAYEAALAAARTDSWKAGWLPYNILDGYQQLVKDFGLWRIDSLGERTAKTDADRQWFAEDRRLREAIVVRDLGYWSHFVGDAAQPMHVSVHYNGWGAFPNPKGYTQEHIHGPFEGEFVRANIAPAQVKAALPPYAACNCTPMAATTRYLQASAARLEPLFQLWGQGGFRGNDPRGVAFTLERITAGAAQLRDFVVDAWRASDNATVGYPGVQVKTLEAAGAVDRETLYGSH